MTHQRLQRIERPFGTAQRDTARMAKGKRPDLSRRTNKLRSSADCGRSANIYAPFAENQGANTALSNGSGRHAQIVELNVIPFRAQRKHAMQMCRVPY